MLRWKFYDPYLADTMTFEINAKEGGEPKVHKNVSTMRTCAPDGRKIVHEGARSPQEFTFRGVLRSTTARDLMQTWVDKMYQIRWTNDLGEQRWIRIHTFTPTRKRVSSRRYKAEYELSAFILDIP